METIKKRKTEDPVDVGTTVEKASIPNQTYRLRNPEGTAQRHDYEITSLTVWSSHSWLINPAEEPGVSAPQGSAEQRKQTLQGTAPSGGPWHALPRTGDVVGAPIVAAEPVFHEKLTKRLEREAARLTMNQDTFLHPQEQFLTHVPILRHSASRPSSLIQNLQLGHTRVPQGS